jgi:exosortase
MIPRSWSKNGWTAWHAVLSMVMMILGVLATLDAWQDIASIAVKDQESSHIFLVPIVTAWLVWVRRGRFRYCRPRGSLIGVVMMLAGWAAYSLGDSFYVQVLWHGGAVLLVLGCLFSVLGIDVFFAYLPAIVIQVFVIPVPGRVRQSIAIPLENITTIVTQNVTELLGLTAQRSGNVLTVNGHEIEIAEACNGLRMVFALVLTSFAFAFGTPLRWYVRLIVVAASPISAIFCNVVRLVPTVYLYGYFPTPIADKFHDISGWVMLPIAFLLLMTVIKLLRWALVPVNYFTLAYD